MKTTKKISYTEEALQTGLTLYRSHPIFSLLAGDWRFAGKEELGKENAAVVTRDGMILLNKDLYLSPAQWAHVIAHCQLHLAFGHFDAEKIPWYAKAGKQKEDLTGKIPLKEKQLWNLACDIYVEKFLGDIKYGETLSSSRVQEYTGSFADEMRIYENLSQKQQGEIRQLYGTASISVCDMWGLEHPIIYDEKKGETNPYAGRFALALAISVEDTIWEAGGHTRNTRYKNPAEEAAEWFIGHYPLLGALAAAFKIVYDYAICIREEIQIAAVDVVERTIYVNPAAGLKKEELKFVLAHEFLHAGLEHQERCQGREPYLWNVACDYIINAWLCEMEVGKLPEGALYDETLSSMSAEAVYDQLISDLKRYQKQATLRGYGKGDILGGNQTGGKMNPTGISVDDFCRNALAQGLEYHLGEGRGYLPAGLVEEIRALAVPPVPWDVELARWFRDMFPIPEKRRSYARPSRRQGVTPEIPRPRYIENLENRDNRTFAVMIDTSGSMSREMIGIALGAATSYAVAREVPYVRVVFCDARAYDAGYMTPEEIAGRVRVKGRGGTVLQPGIDLLEQAEDFPKDGPILVITDGLVENNLRIRRKHAFLIPKGSTLPFRAKGEVFRFGDRI